MNIGEASAASGVSAQMIRHYEDIGLIKALLALWQNKSRSSAAVKKIARGHIDELKRKIAELGSMVQALEHLERHCHGDGRPECPILEHLEGGAGRGEG